MLDPLLVDDPADWPTDWEPLTVVIRSRGRLLELSARGLLDAWTCGALLRDLERAYQPAHTEIGLDLAGITGCDRAAVVALAHCRAFASRVGARLRVTPPDLGRPDGSVVLVEDRLGEVAAAGP